MSIKMIQTFLFELFYDLLKFYFKRSFREIMFNIQFKDNIQGKAFDSKSMRDLIFKDKPTKVNFCYLPQLKLEGEIIPEGQFYVFTYLEGEIFIKKNIDYEIVKQIKFKYY